MFVALETSCTDKEARVVLSTEAPYIRPEELRPLGVQEDFWISSHIKVTRRGVTQILFKVARKSCRSLNLNIYLKALFNIAERSFL